MREIFVRRIAFLEGIIEHAGCLVSDMSRANDFGDALVNRGLVSPSGGSRNREVVGEFGMVEEIAQKMESAVGPLLLLSPSHRTTFNMLDIARENLDPGRNLHLVVFDQHMDFHLDPAEEDDQEFICSGDIGDLALTKGNFLIHALESRLVNSITVVGPAKTEISNLQSAANSRFCEMRAYWERNKDRIDLVPADQSHTVAQTLKKHSIDHILFSVDLDVLRTLQMRYASSEYTPWSIILILGMQDLSGLQGRALSPDRMAVELIYALDGNRYNRSSLNHLPKYQTQINRGGSMKLSEVVKSIEGVVQLATSCGIEMGIKTNTFGGSIIGDVVEFGGQDVGSRLGRATAGLIKRLDTIWRSAQMAS